MAVHEHEHELSQHHAVSRQKHEVAAHVIGSDIVSVFVM